MENSEEGTASERQPTEEELRAALEEQMRKVRVQDLLLQSVASLVNLTARRIAREDERDLEQARVGIEAVRALVDLLPDEAGREVRNALSDLQMLYAQAAEGAEQPAADQDAGEKEPPGGGPEEPPPAATPRRPGGEPPPRLWTPPGST